MNNGFILSNFSRMTNYAATAATTAPHRLCFLHKQNVIDRKNPSQLLHSMTPPHPSWAVATCNFKLLSSFPSFDILLDHLAQSRIFALYDLQSGFPSSKNRTGHLRVTSGQLVNYVTSGHVGGQG